MNGRNVDSRLDLVCLSAPAKVNLGLRIVGRRPDGYHLLESVFWPLDLEDAIELRPSSKFSLTTIWETDARGAEPEPEKNLVTRAFRRLFHGELPDWDVTLKKRIPPLAGLGGGSSDAAAVLRHFGPSLGMTAPRLEDVAAELGADVPYFLNPVPCRVEGIGERRSEIPHPKPLSFFLVFPRFGMETAAVFRRYRELGIPFSAPGREPGNDLESAAVSIEPRLAPILDALSKCNAVYSGLSGTGSTCFAAFESDGERDERTKGLDAVFREASCRGISSRRAPWKSPK